MTEIETKRLRIAPATDAEMADKIALESIPELRQAYEEMRRAAQEHPAQRELYALWQMRRKEDCGGVTRVEAEAEKENITSIRVLEKSGVVQSSVIGEEGPRFVYQG